MKRPRRQLTRRRGYTLVLFFMLLWGILGLAALVIDLGLARAKLRQMQSATDTAALEGLRDEFAPEEEKNERELAQQLFRLTFDDPTDMDEDLIRSETELELQVTPNENLRLAGGLIQDPTNRLWVPEPAENPGDETGGDLEFIADADPNDLIGDQFVARYRLVPLATNNLDADVSKPSSPLPWLFGRLSAVSREGGIEFAERGITMGSVSVAEGGAAMTLGGPVLDLPTAQFAVSRCIWDAATKPSDDDEEPEADEEPSPLETVYEYTGSDVLTIGMPIASPTDEANGATGYAVIFAEFSGTNRVVGFGRIEGSVPQPGHVAWGNVSSYWAQSLLPRDLRDDPILLSNILQAHLSLNNSLLAPKLAPSKFD